MVWEGLEVAISTETQMFWVVGLKNKILTWENLCKRGFARPGNCAMCTKDIEDINYLFFVCPFVVSIWIGVTKILNFIAGWNSNLWRIV